jgi:hypothetical protein
MRKFPWLLIGLIFAGLVAAEAVAAQGTPNSSSAPTTQRQRAPGVPMAPNASEAQKATPQGTDAARERDRLARNRSAPPEPNREVPMPKPVPSIIAP